jgi:hypothetical protein
MPNEEMMMEQMQGGGSPPMPPPPTEMPPELMMMMEQSSQDMADEGGIASMNDALQQAASFGRNGDVYMVHASEGDTVIPMDVLNENPQLKEMLFAQISDMGYDPERYIVGNELNSINPETGMPEFFFKKLLKIAVPVALAAFAPYALPAALGGTGALATAAGGVAGTLASAAGAGIGTLLTGGNLKQAGLAALGTGITSGLTKALTPTDALAGATTDATTDAIAKVGGGKVGVDSIIKGIDPIEVTSRMRPVADRLALGIDPINVTSATRPVADRLALGIDPINVTSATRPVADRLALGIDPINVTSTTRPVADRLALGANNINVTSRMRPPSERLALGIDPINVTSEMRPPSERLGTTTGDTILNPSKIVEDFIQKGTGTFEDLVTDLKQIYGGEDALLARKIAQDYAEKYNIKFSEPGFYEGFLGTRGQKFDKLPGIVKYGLPIAAIGGISSLAGAFKPRMGDQPPIFGDPTQEEIDALRLGFNRYPSNVKYDPLVRGNVRFGNQGGLSDMLPVRKMQSGGINIDYSLRPAQQLESINQLYGQEFGASNLSETDWINSSRFGDFENAVKNIYSSFGGSDIQQMTKDLLKQEERASDQNSPYAPSAQRIAMAIRGRLNQFGINPNPFDPNPPPPPPPDPQPQPDPQTQPQPNPQGQGSDYRVEFGPNGEPYIVGSDGNMFMGGAGTETGRGIEGLISSRPNTGGNVSTGINSEGTPLFGSVPTKLPVQEARPTPYTYYSPSLATVQGIRGLQPEVADLADRFRGGVQETQPVQMKNGGDPMMYGDRPDGLIRGPMGIEEDIIPADLMPGEFVFTKDAVEGVGKLAGGGMREGVKSMYGLMKKFEGVA